MTVVEEQSKETGEVKQQQQQPQQLDPSQIYVPSEDHVEHIKFLVEHAGSKHFGISQQEAEEFDKVFKALNIKEGFLSDESFELIKEFFTKTANEFLVISLPTPNFMRDALKNTIENFRMAYRRLCILEESEECTGKDCENYLQVVKTIKSENFEKSKSICMKWIDFNEKLLARAESLKPKIFENSEIADLKSTFNLTISSFHRNIADIYRYMFEMTEVSPEDYLNKAETHYKTSIELSKDEFPAEFNTCYLSSVLNYSVCLYDCRENHPLALETLQNEYQKAFSAQNNEIREKLSPAQQHSIKILQDVQSCNIRSWMTQKHRSQQPDMSDENDDNSLQSSEASLDNEESDV